ncbi:MAG: T9SS type A sorting domain-containing protein, partial [bacterium]|nr:T9SS type A sorting domain-containing protein [bacterium]
AIAVSGNSAFVADGESGIAIFDVSHPDSLRLIRVLDTPGFASKITTESNFAYTADGDSGLCIHDIANPLQPVEVGRFDTPGIANDVKVSGSYAFIADGPAGIRILNLSDPARPQEVGYYNTLGNANAVSITDSIIFVADGNNFGVFDYSQILGVVNRASEVIPQHFSLKPNYPNPFNSSTEIRYTIAKASIVDLRVFDISGRAIAKLIDFHQNPGEYTFHFEGKSLATGTYFVRLNAGNFSQTQKMVLMK